MEKHWKTVVSRSVCDYFFEAQGKVRRMRHTLSVTCIMLCCGVITQVL